MISHILCYQKDVQNISYLSRYLGRIIYRYMSYISTFLWSNSHWKESSCSMLYETQLLTAVMKNSILFFLITGMILRIRISIILQFRCFDNEEKEKQRKLKLIIIHQSINLTSQNVDIRYHRKKVNKVNKTKYIHQ